MTLILDRDRLYRGTSQSDEKFDPGRLNEPRSVATRFIGKSTQSRLFT